ncbi:MAG: hypothetical protein BHV81_07130 [Butyricimonas synergistica]|nr:MAG: hypothetical protein BHV81_07130 [Butyricimonas synergistica]
MELLVYPIRGREVLPMRTRRRKVVERARTGNGTSIPPIQPQCSLLRDDSGEIVIVIVKPRENSIITCSRLSCGEKRVKSTYSLKQVH